MDQSNNTRYYPEYVDWGVNAEGFSFGWKFGNRSNIGDSFKSELDAMKFIETMGKYKLDNKTGET